jgi:ribosomal protein S18 acetylase RimI-like enzyme
MEVRSLGFRTDLMVRRLAGSLIEDAGDHLIVRSPRHPTFYWGNFLLLAGPPAAGDLPRWLDRFAVTFPAAAHVALGVDGTEVDMATTPEWEEAGLVGQSSVVLTAEHLTAPHHPADGVISRPLRSDLDWRQAVGLRVDMAMSEGSTSDAHRSFLETTVAEARALSDRGHATFFGAFVDGRLRSYLGLVDDGGPVARFQTVETHPAHRRRGLAGDLVYRAGVHGLARPEVTTLVIVAESDGPAIGLYRALGFADRERQAQLERTPPS